MTFDTPKSYVVDFELFLFTALIRLLGIGFSHNSLNVPCASVLSLEA